jgi:hypothetical protein
MKISWGRILEEHELLKRLCENETGSKLLAEDLPYDEGEDEVEAAWRREEKVVG